MNSLQMKSFARWLTVNAAAAIVVTMVAGCSGGGAPTVENPVTSAPQVTDYTGPAAADGDVQAFRINLWENIKANNRCGGCHNAAQPGQSPQFARNDNVNEAYKAANSVVNLSQPDQSRMVIKVGGGHNCWLASPSACADTLTVWIRNWAGANASGGTQIQLQAPVIKEVGGSKGFPVDARTDFGAPDRVTGVTFQNSALYQLVTNAGTANCSRCHSSGAATPQQPFFAETTSSGLAADIAKAADTAFNAIKPKINLNNPEQSRLYLRLKDEFHNCWGTCSSSADTMLAAIKQLSDAAPVVVVDPNLLISKGLTLYDGTVAAGGNRYEAATIAKYEFKTGSGGIVYDTSGHEPALNLTLSGAVDWVGGWGINVKPGGKAQGTASASKKLTDLIKSTGEFSVEVWANNANVAQEDAWLVSYSGGKTSRNFTLAQRMYQYEAYTRSDKTSGNGNPVLLTRAADMDAQAALQHVVLTYSPVEGRKIYVNGEDTGDVDAQKGGSLAEWDDTFALILGNETSTDRQWEGVLRLVAIHNRVLTPAQIKQNFDAGVGEKYFMLFNVSHLVDVPDAYVMLEAQQLDSYGLQFAKPTFISLATGATIPNIPIAGLRIGVNGREAPQGQAYAPVSTTITGANYKAGVGQEIERVGTVIGLQTTVKDDVFFLSFEQIGSRSHAHPDPATPVEVEPAPLPAESDVGLRTFDELNATLAQLTGVSPNNVKVKGTFESVKQALPAIEKFGAFGPAQQTALAQLAIQYCNAMVDDNTLRAAFFGGLDGSGTGIAAFGTKASPNVAARSQLVNALYNKMVGLNLPSQPTLAEVQNELINGYNAKDEDGNEISPAIPVEGLVNRLVAGPTGNDGSGGRTVMKAACGAVLGSGSTLIQ